MARFGALRWAAIATLTLLSMQQAFLHAQEKQAQKSTPAAAAATSQPQVATAQYVGSEACKTCHEDIYNGWEKSPHWKQTYKEGASPSRDARTATAPERLTLRAAATNQDLHLQESLRQRNQRSLPDMPCRRAAAHERDQLRYTPRTT